MRTGCEVKMEQYHLFKFRGRLRRSYKNQKFNTLLLIAKGPKPKALIELPADSRAVDAEDEAAVVVDTEAPGGEAPNNQLPFIDLFLTAR